jgi:hypothetical protein
MYTKASRLLATLLFFATSTLAVAGSSVSEANSTLLTIEVVENHKHTSHMLNINELDALPQVSFETSTIWTEGVVTFSGPSLAKVLESVDAAQKTITAFALNDYNMVIAPMGADDTYPIVATRMNGERFSVRDRGPLWLVYPYDSDPEFRDEKIYAQSIWQLHKLKLD